MDFEERMEAADKAQPAKSEREAIERLRELLRATEVGYEEVAAELAAANAQRNELLSKLETWCRTGGKHYVPTPGSSDSFGDGVRQAQREIQAMVSAAIARAQSGQPARDWPEDAAHENGQYQCICATCGASFVGHKRRVQCKACAQSEQPAQRDDDLSKHDDHCNCERCR